MELSSFSRDLIDSLTAAFDEQELRELTKFGMRADLDAEIAQGPRRTRVLGIVEWAERRGRLEELFAAALSQNPGNRELREFARRLSEQTSAETDKLFAVVQPLKTDDPFNNLNAEALRTALDTPQTSVGGLQALAVNSPNLLGQPGLLDVINQLWSAKSRICLITIGDRPRGTGFLVGPDRIMTNSHVIPTNQDLGLCRVVFDFVGDAKVSTLPTYPIAQTLARSEVRELDFAIHRLDKIPVGARGQFSIWEHEFEIREPVVVVGHSGGVSMSSTFGALFDYNKLFERIAYTANTQPGGSGSPVFTQDWKLVALHHHGQENVNNHGITMFGIVEYLRRHAKAEMVTVGRTLE